MRNATLLFLLSCAAALAQPTITAGGVVNSASYAPGFMPNMGIAQGAMFVIFGSGLGPATLQQVSSYPLPTSQGLGGTSVTVTIAGTSIPCVMIYTVATQVAAVLPSRTPQGLAMVTVTYNGVTSSPAPVQVVPSAFGAFSLASSGAGPGVVQNIDSATSTPVNTFVQPARPNETAVIWGTGLGPVPGNEGTEAPTPVDISSNVDLELFVGGMPARVLYAGRSGCCTGIDEIAFQVPAGVEGCFVPIAVITYGITSNLTTMAIASSGSTCSDPFGFSATDLQKGVTSGPMRLGSINLASNSLTLSAGGYSDTTRSDTGSGAFTQASIDQVIRGNIVGTPSLGTCVTATVVAGNGPQAAPPASFLDTGSVLNITGPAGKTQLTAAGKGAYSGSLGNAFLQPGAYTVDNGGGGADVGAFQAQISIPPVLNWTNANSIEVQNLTPFSPVEIDWTGGDPSGAVAISGASLDLLNTGNGGIFICLERASKGQFTIPSYVLSAMPPTTGPYGLLGVSGSGVPVKFAASGLDAGYVSYTEGTSVNVTFVLPTAKK